MTYATEAALEVLNSEYSSLIALGDFMDCADPRGYVLQSNVLLDACLDAGMSYDEPDHVAWAGERVTAWLLDAPLCGCGRAVAEGRFVSRAGDYWRACAPCADTLVLEAA